MEFSAFAFIILKRIRRLNAIMKYTIKRLKWVVELRNVKFEIRTDRKNLEYFMTVKNMTER